MGNVCYRFGKMDIRETGNGGFPFSSSRRKGWTARPVKQMKRTKKNSPCDTLDSNAIGSRKEVHLLCPRHLFSLALDTVSVCLYGGSLSSIARLPVIRSAHGKKCARIPPTSFMQMKTNSPTGHPSVHVGRSWQCARVTCDE
jgi:hypothetical protein